MEKNEITEGKEQLPVRYCWNCEKIFDAYEVVLSDRTFLEERFCSTECHSEWLDEGKDTPPSQNS